MEFLQHSTAERKRAVFLEGGTCGAKLMCLDAIGKAYTVGNLEKAAAIFDRLMSQGLKSLEDDGFDVDSIIDPKSSDTWVGNPDVNKDVWANKGIETNGREDDDEMEDPITKAMRAADALDRETENLQPPNHDVDLSVPLDFGLIKPRARSLSMSAVENMAAAPDGVIREREVDLDMPTAANTNAFQLLPSPLLFPSNPATRTSFLAVSPPKITQGQLRKARSYEPPQNLKDIKFNLKVDDFDNAQMASIAAQHWHARELTDGAGIGVATTLPGSGTGTEGKDREWDGTASISNYSTATPTTHDATHDATHVGSHATVSPKPPRFHVPLRNFFEKKPRICEGLNLEDGAIGTEGRTSSDETKPFEPLLPFNEHYVLHFSNRKPDDQFNLVSSRYKDCFDSNYRPSTSYSPKPDATAVSPHITKELRYMTPSEHNMYPASEYDPYRYEEQPKPEPQSTTPGYVFPASFPITPSASRFHDLSTHNKTAVWVQNTLRSVLDNHTPVEEIDYLSSDADSPDPQLRSLWEPLMCAEMDQQKEEKKIDLILAIGAEGGVKKDLKQGVMAKIEHLGFPSNGDGMSRSGRLSLRYLIGNAMQTFTSQPLTQQSKENPFSNPTLLASLIIPHIDTYLRGSDNVRFLLIEYPVEHLSTMLAMQKLMGSQVMKVAGISKETDTTIFSMADYRLSAMASEAEISECVGAIRDTLASISDFYNLQTSAVPASAANDAVQGEKEVTTKPLSIKSSNLTNASIAPLLPPQQHSPRHNSSPVVMPKFTALSTPPPPLLPASSADTYNHTHTYVHSNGQNHGHGHINTYMPTAAIHLPTRSISPPPCSHCSSTPSTSLISHGTVPVPTPTVVPPQSPHSITRATSQRPSISGGSRPTPSSPSGSSTISPRTKIPSTISTATTCVVHQNPPPTLVPTITTTNTTSTTTPGAAATTTRLQSPLSLSSGPLSSGASISSLLSTDFNTDVDDTDSEAKDDDHQVESDEDPFDFFEIDFEERRLMPMFLKSQIEAHVAASAAAIQGHRSPVGNREVVDLETLLGGGRKDFGERFASGQGLQCPLPPDEVLGGRGSRDGNGNGESEKTSSEKQRGGIGKKQQHKKGSKKTTGRNSSTETPAPAVVGLGTVAAAPLEADEARKPSKNLKKKKKKKNTATKAHPHGHPNAAPNRPLSPNNPNLPDPGNGGGNNNTYTRPASRKTTTTMKDQQASTHSPGGVGVAVAHHMGGEQMKALRWLGLA
ncbi:hypothetical protein N0V85_007515 [Neurospora sp. IMI 360204]|nr:hypothetical protein N0V85_007515 [Neurospora sp. IMI 360204]